MVTELSEGFKHYLASCTCASCLETQVTHALVLSYTFLFRDERSIDFDNKNALRLRAHTAVLDKVESLLEWIALIMTRFALSLHR